MRIIGITVATFALILAHAAHATGPSFDCAAAHAPVAQVICADPATSQTDLEYAQAYYALRQQVGQAGWKALLNEAISFENGAAAACGIAQSGSPPADEAKAATCLRDAYTRQRAVWAERLTGAAAEEAARPINQHINLQGALQLAGYLPANEKVDGVYGEATRAAILKLEQAKTLPMTGFMGDAEADAVGPQAHEGLGSEQEPTPSERILISEHSGTCADYNEVVTTGNTAGLDAFQQFADMWFSGLAASLDFGQSLGFGVPHKQVVDHEFDGWRQRYQQVRQSCAQHPDSLFKEAVEFAWYRAEVDSGIQPLPFVW